MSLPPLASDFHIDRPWMLNADKRVVNPITGRFGLTQSSALNLFTADGNNADTTTSAYRMQISQLTARLSVSRYRAVELLHAQHECVATVLASVNAESDQVFQDVYAKYPYHITLEDVRAKTTDIIAVAWDFEYAQNVLDCLKCRLWKKDRAKVRKVLRDVVDLKGRRFGIEKFVKGEARARMSIVRRPFVHHAVWRDGLRAALELQPMFK